MIDTSLLMSLRLLCSARLHICQSEPSTCSLVAKKTCSVPFIRICFFSFLKFIIAFVLIGNVAGIAPALIRGFSELHCYAPMDKQAPYPKHAVLLYSARLSHSFWAVWRQLVDVRVGIEPTLRPNLMCMVAASNYTMLSAHSGFSRPLSHFRHG